jgi:hypothetical protein
MRESVEILLRTIVDVVHQLVAHHRRPLDGTEEAAGNAAADERPPFHCSQPQKWTLAAKHLVLEVDDPAAYSFGISGEKATAPLADRQAEALPLPRLGNKAVSIVYAPLLLDTPPATRNCRRSS